MGWETERARVAGLTRHRTDPKDPDLIAARRDLAAERLADYVQKVVDTAPPLTEQQRTRIAALLQAPPNTADTVSTAEPSR